MASEIVLADDGVLHVRISRRMTVADQKDLEGVAREWVDAGREVRVLITLEDFEGWEHDKAWADDLEFVFKYGSRIARIAIAGEERWRDRAIIFAGKGFRKTEIEYFSLAELNPAKEWVRQS